MSYPVGFIELEAVSDDEAGVDLTPLSAVEQRLHVALHVALAGFDAERAIHHRSHGPDPTR